MAPAAGLTPEGRPAARRTSYGSILLRKTMCYHIDPTLEHFKIKMAPAVGFEPTTKWLTATYSTAELCRSE